MLSIVYLNYGFQFVFYIDNRICCGYYASSNYGLFLVFHICVGMVVVGVRASFLVFGGNYIAYMGKVCCSGI